MFQIETLSVSKTQTMCRILRVKSLRSLSVMTDTEGSSCAEIRAVACVELCDAEVQIYFISSL